MKELETPIRRVLAEVTLPDGTAAVARFPSLRSVDAKVRELTLLLDQLPTTAQALRDRFRTDDDFKTNSRRVRLEALANYCSTILRFLSDGVLRSERKPQKAPDFSLLTGAMPNLDTVIADRWLESQTTWFAGAHLSSVILMGSILEALLLARILMSRPEAERATHAPRRAGAVLQFHDWKLTHLIDVAVELHWLKLDRGMFSHALRESRNIVHPYQQATSGVDFDEGTCKTCWQVLNAAAEDLLASAGPR